MNFSQFVRRLFASDLGRQRQASIFDIVVLELLRRDLAGPEAAPILVGERPALIGFDAVLPTGIDDIPGPAVVDIRFSTNPRVLLHAARKTAQRVASPEAFASSGIAAPKSYLLIVPFSTNSEEVAKHTGELRELLDLLNVRVDVWGLDELEHLAARHDGFVDRVLPEWEALGIAQLVAPRPPNEPSWRELQGRLLSEAARAYRSDDLVLFLGAGVSQSVGVPGWNELLTRLLVAMVARFGRGDQSIPRGERSAVVDQLQSVQNQSPLLLARYLRTGLGEDFEKELRSALYQQSAKVERRDTSTLESVAQLCIPPRGSVGVRAVVTYNFDDYLERSLRRHKVDFTPIFSEGDPAPRNMLGIYHVHGFLPYRTADYLGSSDSILVFSEEKYHLLYNDPYGWSNITQLGFLLDSTCVFIGLSMTDPNLRRLLEIAARKTSRPRHIVLLQRQTAVNLPPPSNGAPPVDQETVEYVLDAHHRLVERSYSELGVLVLWYQSHDDLPDLLARIRAESVAHAP